MRTIFFLLATIAGLALSATTESDAIANSADTDLTGAMDHTDLGDLTGMTDSTETAEAPDAAARWCSRRCRVGIHTALLNKLTVSFRDASDAVLGAWYTNSRR